MGSKINQIWLKQMHIQVENHARIDNLASIYYDYLLNITILSKWVSVLNQNLRIKNH